MFFLSFFLLLFLCLCGCVHTRAARETTVWSVARGARSEGEREEERAPGLILTTRRAPFFSLSLSLLFSSMATAAASLLAYVHRLTVSPPLPDLEPVVDELTADQTRAVR